MVERALRRDGKPVPKDQVELLHDLRGLTRQAIQRLPEGAFRRSVRRLDYPDLPRARLAFRYFQVQGRDASIPVQPVLAALNELVALRQQGAGQAVARIPIGDIAAPGLLGVV